MFVDAVLMRCSPPDMNILAYGAIEASYTVGRIRIIGNSDLRRTNVHAKIAVNTLPLNLKSHEAETIEMGIDRPERTECAAEGPACKDKQNKKCDHDRNFENIQPPDHIRLDHRHRVRGIEWIPDHPGNAGAQCAPWTDPAEPVRFDEVREKNCEDEERHILPVFQARMDPELSALDLVRLVLYPSERAEPSANRSAKDDANRSEEPDEGEWEFADCAEVLENADWAGGEGGRTGVTVESREAGLLQRAIVDFF
jgi:hypothetical protein